VLVSTETGSAALEDQVVNLTEEEERRKKNPQKTTIWWAIKKTKFKLGFSPYSVVIHFNEAAMCRERNKPSRKKKIRNTKKRK
jgi:hypothetical protein